MRHSRIKIFTIYWGEFLHPNISCLHKRAGCATAIPRVFYQILEGLEATLPLFKPMCRGVVAQSVRIVNPDIAGRRDRSFRKFSCNQIKVNQFREIELPPPIVNILQVPTVHSTVSRSVRKVCCRKGKQGTKHRTRWRETFSKEK